METEETHESVQERNKKRSEKLHQKVHRFLTREFPGCTVTYDGFEGLDHKVVFNGNVTWAETKTCQMLVRQGIDRKKTDFSKSRFAVEKPARVGRIKFDKRPTPKGPYKKSQHEDLVDLNGWYVFIVDQANPELIFGVQANQLRLSPKPGEKKISWAHVLERSYPDWVQRLKHQVYCLPPSIPSELKKEQLKKEKKPKNDKPRTFEDSFTEWCSIVADFRF